MAAARAPKYAPLLPDIEATLSPSATPSHPRRVSAFASRAYVAPSSFAAWMATVVLAIPAFVLLIVGDLRNGYGYRRRAHLVGFPLAFIAISMLANIYATVFYVANTVLKIEWRDPAFRGHATALHQLSALCDSWQFHAFEASAIAFGAFLVICQTYLNGELTAGVVLCFVLSVVHWSYLFVPLHRARFVFEVRAASGDFLTMVPAEETEPLKPIYRDVEPRPADTPRNPEALESGT